MSSWLYFEKVRPKAGEIVDAMPISDEKHDSILCIVCERSELILTDLITGKEYTTDELVCWSKIGRTMNENGYRARLENKKNEKIALKERKIKRNRAKNRPARELTELESGVLYEVCYHNMINEVYTPQDYVEEYEEDIMNVTDTVFELAKLGYLNTRNLLKLHTTRYARVTDEWKNAWEDTHE